MRADRQYSYRFVFIGLLVFLLLSQSVLASQARPVLVVSASGNLAKSESNQMLDAANRSIVEAILTSLSESLYGTDRAVFPHAKPYRGQVEVLVNTMKVMDKNLQQNIAKLNLKSEGRRRVSYELFWTSSNLGNKAAPGSMVDLLLRLLIHEVATRHDFGFVRPIGSAAFRSQLIEGNDEIVQRLKQESFDKFNMFDDLRAGLPAMPIYALFDFNLDPQAGVGVTFKVLFQMEDLPNGANGRKVSPIDVETALIDKIIYKPQNQGRGVVELSFSRNYGFAQRAYSPALAQITFGTLERGDMSAVPCIGEKCARWIDAIPTLYFRVNPAKNSWFVRTQAWLASMDKFELAIRGLAVDLHTLALTPGGADVVFRVDAYGSGSKIIDMKHMQARNWFEYFAQRQGAIDGQILPAFDNSIRAKLDLMMTKNIDTVLFGSVTKTSKTDGTEAR